MPTEYDAIVIGAGQAGPSLAARLATAGLRTLLVERERLGGTCVNTGCIPTKTLVASARAAHIARRAADYGVSLHGPVVVDMAAVKRRKDGVVDHSRRNLAEWMERTPQLDLRIGHPARFVRPREIVVGDEVFTAEQVFINVGARPRVPDWPGLDVVPYLTSSSMMDVDFLPAHLLVVGASYIGLEFAQIYRRFGSAVTVVEQADDIVAREDADTRKALREILEGEGVTFHLGIREPRVDPDAEGLALTFASEGQHRRVTASHLLFAVGRTPNTDDLGLDQAGIEINAAGYIDVDEQLHTSAPGVWAMGDVNGRGAFTHTSFNDYEILAANLLDGEARRLRDRVPVYALFTDPPLGRVGMTETEARARGGDLLSARLPMTSVGRAREMGETQGFLSVVVDARSETILGAAFLGVGCDEAVQSVLTAMISGASYRTMQRAMYIHPTVAEFLPTLFQALKPMV